MKALSCDVLVVGGGAAGVAAATAAGRGGARVMLLERYGFLGGLATAGLVGTVCGLYRTGTPTDPPELVAGGFLREFADRLADAACSAPLALEGGLWALPFAPWAFERLAEELLSGAGDVTPVLHATLAGVEAEGGRITGVRALAWNEELQVHPAWVIDASGEATAAALAGVPTEDGSTEQDPALIFVMENVDPGFWERGMLDVLRGLRRAVEQGRLPAGADRVALVPGTGRGGRVAFKINLAASEPGRPAWAQVTDWERRGRALADAAQDFLIENIAAFRHARFSRAAMQLGVRSGRRIHGVATLSDEDVLGCRRREDGIARGCWPSERWCGGPRPQVAFLPQGGYYEIPLDCLRPAGLANAMAAGRCLAATAGALGSARVIGTALATGWAAGMAAALQAGGKTREEAISVIRGQMDA